MFLVYWFFRLHRARYGIVQNEFLNFFFSTKNFVRDGCALYKALRITTEAKNTSHDTDLLQEELIKRESNNDLPGSPASISSDGDSADADLDGPDSGGSMVELLTRTMKDNDLDELRRLLDSEDGLLDALITTQINYDGDEKNIHLTAIQWTAAFSEPSIINLLLEYGAKVDEEIPLNVNQKDRNGISPLHLASRFGTKENVSYLLEAGADCSLQDNNADRPFHFCSKFGNLETLKFLYERGSQSYIDEANSECATPLHLASEFGHRNVVKWLLDLGRAINQPGPGGNTPLCLATAKGHVETVGELLSRGPDIHKRNDKSYSPILLACANARGDILGMLIEAGALLSDVTEDNNTCFHLAIKCDWEFSENTMVIISTLVSLGADINQSNASGFSPLVLACAEQKLEHIEFLLRYGADSNQMVVQNLTPLMVACMDTDSRIVKLLLQHNADTTITNSVSLTALLFAVEFNQLETVKLLIQNGANIICPDRQGTTPLAAAVLDQNNLDVALEILAAEQYYPKDPSAEHHYMESTDNLREIETGILQAFESAKYETLERLYVIMYWVVSNNAMELVTRCIDHDQQLSKKGMINWKNYFGPDSIMREAREDSSQRSLDLLEKRLKKDYRPPSSSFGIQKQISPDPANLTSSHYGKPYNEESSSGNPHEFDLRWIHLPVNELHLMRVSCMVTPTFLQKSDNVFLRIFIESSPSLPLKRNQDTNHNHPISGVDGNQTPKKVNTGTCAAIYMPYLDIGTYHPTVNKSPTTENPTVLDESINERNSRAIKHTPMTLDQYYYPTIEDTSKRDNDQVLSKFLQKKSGQSKETIITATTHNFDKTSKQSSKADREPPESLLQNSLDNILYGETKSQFERARSVDSLMELLLGVASGLFIKRFVPVSEQIYKGPIEIFRESIRDVAEKESSLFQEFLQGLQEANPREPEQKQGQPSNAKSDSKSPDGPMPLNRYHVISSETELLDMIRDIRDELHMLRSLAEDQEIVWKQAFASSDLMHFKAYTPTNVKKDLDDMLSEADKTENYINTLLDLRQAEFGRLQAYDSARQSNSIFIFTIMTIVFLPLSFLTFLFALNVSDLPHEGDNVQYKAWWIFPILFGITALVSVPATIFAWKVNAISSFRPRNNIASESSTHTDAIKGVLSSVRRRGRKQHDIEAR
ncbi:hypothetical protein BCON_0098g00210 [Botryotinia convoluta]|uniref:Uncharacterized protein n=1 Tax=Botryotinia convoluta TaxID=54673 RepID=A0A4Z1I0B8_9HELO|nr:hypothetical protein BCON_0098g00210 [Botryotinia convoluta]